MSTSFEKTVGKLPKEKRNDAEKKVRPATSEKDIYFLQTILQQEGEEED